MYFQNVQYLAQGRRSSRGTVLAVVHKLDTVVDGFDHIVVLERGRMVEFGSPKELLARSGECLGGWGIVGCDYGFGTGRRL